MSNYTKSTNFATKDNLSPGDPLKIVRGTEIDTEFNNISTAISTKTDNSAAAITGGSITGITDLAIADGGTGASTATAALNNLLPSQTGNSSKYLQTDGTNATWDAISINTGDITGTLPVANGGTGITSFGTGIATFLGTPSSANLISAVTDETGSGALVFANTPTLVAPILGTPTSGNFSSGSFTWPTFNQNTTGTAAGLSATLAIASGGTGQTTANAAFNALAPSQTSASGKYLKSDGTNTSWDALDISTADITGTLPIANGGTGATTAGGALTSLGAYAASNPSGYTSNTGTVTSVGGTGTVNGISLSGTVTTSGNLTLGGTLSGIANSALTNSSITIGGTAIALGASSNALANDITVNGLTVGRGAGAVATNTAVGASALASGSLSGGLNTAVGYVSLNGNTTGVNNSGFGYGTLAGNITGSNSVAVGTYALNSNTTASNNTAVGYQASYTSTTGTHITAIGYQAMKGGTSADGSYSVAVGSSALFAITSGVQNTAVGYNTMTSTTTGNNNSAFGQGALALNTTGSSNTAIGQNALPSNTTASNSTAVGYQAGYTNQTGTPVTALGYKAGYSNLSGNVNTYLGYQSGYTNSTASYCVFVGHEAGYTYNGSLGSNTHVGYRAGYLSTGDGNTFVGARYIAGGTSCGSAMTTGSKNTILGSYSGNQGGLDIRTASNYIVLSDGDGNPRGYFDGSGNLFAGTTTTTVTSGGLYLGVNNGGTGVSQLNLGHITGAANGSGFAQFFYAGTGIGSITQNGTTGVLFNLTSDYRLKNNPQALTGAKDFVMALQPKKWQWWDGSGEGVGFIAHEFMEVAKYSGHGEKDAIDDEGKPIMQSIQPSSSEVMANLVSLIQEQQAIIESLKARLDAANL